ncbi:MAG: serine hydrolase domain-containing protein [Thermomicrobiales bacterium]
MAGREGKMAANEMVTGTTDAARLDAAIDAALAEERVVGGVVQVSRGGEPAYERAFGLADREAGTPVTADTIFRLASVTKPVVSLTALRLIEQDEMSLDDPIHEWLPDFRPVGPDGQPATILIRHLLTHTSGLSYAVADQGVSTGLAQPGLSMTDNLARLAALPLPFMPGTSWAYGLSIDVLGAVIQKVTCGTLEEAVRDHVLRPLGLPADAFVFALPEGTPNLAVPYVNDDPRPHRMTGEETVGAGNGDSGTTFDPARIFDAASFQSGGAGAASTGSVIHAILEAVRRDAEDGRGRLLSRAMAKALFESQIGALLTEPGTAFSFAGAVVLDPKQVGSPVAPGTLRWGGVYGHNWFVDPTVGLTATILTNTIFEGMNGQLTVDIRNALYAR